VVRTRGVADQAFNTPKEYAMKRFVIPALVSMFVIVLAGVAGASDVFWNPEDDQTNDATITKKDFPYKGGYTNPTKSFQELDIYYTPSQVTVDEEEDETVVRRPARRREPVDRPAAEITPRRSAPRPKPAPAVETRPIEKPRPAIVKKPERSVTVETGKPAGGPTLIRGKRSMKWGQVEVKPAEPKTRSPLQWGQNNK
jgi:hypothetical protein